MSLHWQVKLLLLAIAAFLAVIAFRPVVQPAPVLADGSHVYPFYVEPGYTMLRKPDGTSQVYGKMVIDMRTGDIWGFPTTVPGPYPVNNGSTTPPKSHPMYLGRFLLSEAAHNPQ